jgi:RimJ/RimL family protein N-acetyltransferase
MTFSSLATQRLILRPFALDDLDHLAAILADPDVTRYLPGGNPRTRDQTEKTLRFIIDHWEQHGFGWWAVVAQANHELIGWCGLKLIDTTGEVEVLYLFAKSHWGKGYATEAAAASLRYGFEELRLERIIALAVPENAASRRVMEKLGMQYEKTAVYYNLDLAVYAIARNAFRPGAASYTLTKDK